MNTCPKCQNQVQEKDVVCLHCGCNLKKIEKKFTTAPVSKPKGKESAPKPPSPLGSVGTFFSFLFFGFTIFFAYAYILNFSLLLNLTDSMLIHGYFSLCDKTYTLYEKIALSKDQDKLPFRHQQLKVELALSQKKEFIPTPITMQVLETYQDDDHITHLKILLNNQSLYPFVSANAGFYLKSPSNNIYPALPSSDEENIGPIKIQSWNKITGGISFKGLPELKDGKGLFSGKIIFNDGKRYAVSPVKLISHKTEASNKEGWALIQKEETSGSY
jgi:hypothetical protein